MLFADTPEREYALVVKFVNTTLRDLGYDPDQARLDSPAPEQTRWRIQKGSAAVFITVLHETRQNILRLVAPILHAAGVSEPVRLHRRLLELNLSTLYQCAFALDPSGDVVVTSDRLCVEIDREEVKSMIDVLAFFADRYDDELVEEFGGSRWGE